MAGPSEVRCTATTGFAVSTSFSGGTFWDTPAVGAGELPAPLTPLRGGFFLVATKRANLRHPPVHPLAGRTNATDPILRSDSKRKRQSQNSGISLSVTTRA